MINFPWFRFFLVIVQVFAFYLIICSLACTIVLKYTCSTNPDTTSKHNLISCIPHSGLMLYSVRIKLFFLQVADCCTREFTDQKRLEMSVSEFIDHWLGFSAGNCGNDRSCNGSSQSLLYLKDWHFVKVYLNLLSFFLFSLQWLPYTYFFFCV